MGAKTRQYSHGEIIFREGEPGKTMFLVSSGGVSLSKETKQGPLEIEILNAGAYFGEIGILNGGTRTMTATAVGDLLVEIIDPSAVKNSGEKPELGGLNSSKSTNTITYDEEKISSVTDSWLSRLVRRRNQNSPNIEVRIVPLLGHHGDRYARLILNMISNLDGINARIVPKEGPFTHKSLSEKVIAACCRDSHKILQKSGGDILIWGDSTVDNKVLNLHLTSTEPSNDEILTSFCGFDILPLPLESIDDWQAFVYAVILAATSTKKSNKFRIINSNIERALKEGGHRAQKPPREFTTTNKAHLLTCLGHTLAVSGQRLKQPKLFQSAVENYRRAIEMLSKEEISFNWGLAHKNLAMLLAQQAECTDDFCGLPEAIDVMVVAIEAIPKRFLPQEWAAAQNRLGLMLYRLHLIDVTADTQQLTMAITAFHSALKIYTRLETPDRWANVMHNFACAAQVLGGQQNDPNIIQKSISACRNILEVRRPATLPHHWAQTHNTLGSALFLLGKITNHQDYLISAHDAFTTAHEFYVSNKLEKMAHVISRNIKHVETLLNDPRRLVNHYTNWQESSGEVESNLLDWKQNKSIKEVSQQALGQ